MKKQIQKKDETEFEKITSPFYLEFIKEISFLNITFKCFTEDKLQLPKEFLEKIDVFDPGKYKKVELQKMAKDFL